MDISKKDIVPGETIAGPTLQRDTWNVMRIFDEVNAPDCKDRKVVNTEVIDRTGTNVWIERWTVDHCGEKAFFRVEFRSSMLGGTDFSVSEEK